MKFIAGMGVALTLSLTPIAMTLEINGTQGTADPLGTIIFFWPISFPNGITIHFWRFAPSGVTNYDNLPYRFKIFALGCDRDLFVHYPELKEPILTYATKDTEQNSFTVANKDDVATLLEILKQISLISAGD